MNKLIILGNTLQNTVGLVRSLGEVGLKVELIIEPCKKTDCFVALSRYVNKVHYLKSLDNCIEILLREYGHEEEKPIIFCGSDPTISIIDDNLDILSNSFHVFNANSEQGRINYYLDKRNTFDIASKVGLNIIDTQIITKNNVDYNKVEYPCFIKGCNSTTSTKGDIHICNNENELKSSLREGVTYFLQPYIEKDYELNIIGFSCNHGKDVVIPGAIRKIRESLVRMGEYMRLEELTNHPIDTEAIKNLVSEIGYEGPFSVEFLCRGNKSYFLEINLRNDGLGYILTAAGANFPYLWVKYVNGKVDSQVLESVKIKTPFYVMHENDMYNIIEGKISVWKWFHDFNQSNAFLIMNAKDPLPFIGSTCIHARQLMKKICRLVFKK